MNDDYWIQQRIDALIYRDHERNHYTPDHQCWYCQNERADAITDSIDAAVCRNTED